MDEDDDVPAPKKRNPAQNIWAACVVLLLGPSLLVWIVRGVGLAMQCAPAADLCHGIPLGGGFRDALTLAWLVASNTLFLIVVSIVAAVASVFARRPLLGASTLLLLPLAALMLPMAAVYTALHGDCRVSEAGIGDCTLWGAQMGMSFHTAASVPWLIYGFAPYSFSLALMLGLIGWFVTREKPVHATASAHRYPDERFTHRD